MADGLPYGDYEALMRGEECQHEAGQDQTRFSIGHRPIAKRPSTIHQKDRRKSGHEAMPPKDPWDHDTGSYGQ